MLPRKIPVIIDTDPGVDDVVAILLALASPEFDILAFILSFGNTDIETAYNNILKVYQVISLHLERHPDDKRRFPCYLSSKPYLARGAGGPLEGDLHNAHYFHGRDGLGDIETRHPDLNVNEDAHFPQLQFTDKGGAELTLELLRTHPSRSIVYIALGPLTNLAQAVRLDAVTVRDRVGRIVCMGGALDVPGNTTPVAEFNFFADPYAVKELLAPSEPLPGIPLDRFLLLPLDITTSHKLPFGVYMERVDPTFDSSKRPSLESGKSPLVHFTSSFLERTREVMLDFGVDAMELHDIVAVWCAIQNPPVADESGMPQLGEGWKAIKRVFDIERTGELTRGMLVVDRRADDQSAFAPGMNRAEVQAELQRHLVKDDSLESSAVPARVQVEHANDKNNIAREVECVVQTPGPAALLEILLERVWGVARN